VRRLYLDKKLAGVALAPTVWFNVWGAWNLYYYRHLNQPLSWGAGFLVFLVNTTWVLMAVYYTRKGRPQKLQKCRAVELRYMKGDHMPLVLELNDGRIFRSDPPGIVWYGFPDGERVDVFFETWLEQESMRIRNVMKWIDQPFEGDKEKGVAK